MVGHSAVQGRRVVTQFRSEIIQRIGRVRAELDAARAAGEEYLVEVHLGELESLARLAAEHDIHIGDAVVEEPAA
jgi:hypothetical protein